MGQQEIINFLKKDEANYYSANELGKRLNINVHTVRVALKKMEIAGELLVRELPSPGSSGLTKFYQVREVDETFEAVLKDIDKYQLHPRFAGFGNLEMVRQVMLLTEIRKLREELKNAKK